MQVNPFDYSLVCVCAPIFFHGALLSKGKRTRVCCLLRCFVIRQGGNVRYARATSDRSTEYCGVVFVGGGDSRYPSAVKAERLPIKLRKLNTVVLVSLA